MATACKLLLNVTPPVPKLRHIYYYSLQFAFSQLHYYYYYYYYYYCSQF